MDPTANIRLNNLQEQQLHGILLEAFDEASLRRAIKFGMNANLDEVGAGVNYQDRVFNLIQWAGSGDRFGELLVAASKANPTHEGLQAFVTSLRSLQRTPPALDLASGLSSNSGPDAPRVGIPFVVLAMTAAEAAQLDDGSILTDRRISQQDADRFQQFVEKLKEQRKELRTLLPDYAADRDSWKPRGFHRREIHVVIQEIVDRINASRAEVSGVAQLQVDLLSADFFADDPPTRQRVRRRLRGSGGVLIIDAVSLFHPTVRDELVQSGLAPLERVATLLLSPIGTGDIPANQFMDEICAQQLEDAFARFNQDLDKFCDFSLTDSRAMQRWLYAFLPEVEKIVQSGKATAANVQQVQAAVGAAKRGVNRLF